MGWNRMVNESIGEEKRSSKKMLLIFRRDFPSREYEQRELGLWCAAVAMLFIRCVRGVAAASWWIEGAGEEKQMLLESAMEKSLVCCYCSTADVECLLCNTDDICRDACLSRKFSTIVLIIFRHIHSLSIISLTSLPLPSRFLLAQSYTNQIIINHAER
jgi:hypothetical protein